MALNFPDAPTIGQVYEGYVWDGEKWQVQGDAAAGAVRYDIAQGLTTTQQAQARANLDVTKKNYIINGAMMVSQENGSTAGTTAGYYPVDNCYIDFANAGAISTAQVASATPAGSPNRLRVTVTTADASVAAGDVLFLQQRIEGLRVADLLLGTASAKTFTLQFGVKAPAGTYCVVFINSAANRSYVAEYTITGGEANTDVVKSVTVPGDTSGTWLTTTSIGLTIRWGLMVGSTYHKVAGSWGTGNVYGSTNQFNFMGTVNNVFELFDVSLTEGTVAPPFVIRPYDQELLTCQRYYQLVKPGSTNHAFASGVFFNGTLALITYRFPVSMRAAPTLIYSAADFSVIAASSHAISTISLTAATVNGVRLDIVTATGVAGQGAILQTANSASNFRLDARL